jgi:hypothetical protein
MRKAELQRHPDTHCDAVARIQVEVGPGQGPVPQDALQVRFTLHGDLSSLLLPEATPARRVDQLWKHTCCEVFLGAAQSSQYLEFNFSPSTSWAAYRFSAYREGMTNADLAPPRIQIEKDAAVVMQVELNVPKLSAFDRLAIACVIEERDQNISYWALRHPAGKPDFHHAAGFAMPMSGVHS